MGGIIARLGSLKPAVILLTAWAVSMVLASLHEAGHGTEAAIRDFYGSTWFAALMAAVGVNVLSAIVVRWPPRRSQAGFVIAHVSVLIVLVGALVTRLWAVHGNLWLQPGETRADFDSERWALTLSGEVAREAVRIPIGSDGPAQLRGESSGSEGRLSLEIEQYASDTVDEGERVIADAESKQAAVKLQFSRDGREHRAWLLSGQPNRLGNLVVRFGRVTDAQRLAQLLQPASRPGAPDQGKVVVELGGQSHIVEISTAMGRTVPVGGTGYQLSVRRYLPHATVVGREIRTASSRPVNPMVEFEVIGPEGRRDMHRLFARFPDRDFASMHGAATSATRSAGDPSAATSPSLKLRYIGATLATAEDSILDVLLGSDGRLHFRFADDGGGVTTAPAEFGKPVTTPWDSTQVAVLDMLPNARSERALKPIAPRQKDRVPAVFVRVGTPSAAHRMWIRRGESFDVRVGRADLRVGYMPTRIDLGFSIKLLEPIITYYPGTDSPRTYQSRVLVEDSDSRSRMEKTISMNAPLKYGGYRFYQSNYQFDGEGKPVASMLSVARDRGEAIVYLGYVGLMVGLVTSLAQRMRRTGFRSAGGTP